jgi:O-antigen/teichoic acid export membrane protein
MSVAVDTGGGLFKRLATGGAWAIAGRAGLAVTGLVINVLVARQLPPGDVGVYFLVLSGLAMAVVLSQFGLQHAVVKLVAEAIGAGDAASARGVIRAVLIMGCGFAALLGLVFGLGGDALIGLFAANSLAPGVTALIGLWILAKTAEGLVAESFRGLHDIRLATLQNMLLANLLLVVFLATLWLTGQANLLSVLTLSVVASVLATVVGYGLLQRRFGKGSSIKPKPRQVLRVAAPMFVTSVMLVVISQADLWVVARFLPPEQVAVYGAAARLVQLVMVPMLIVNAVLPPFVASLYREGRLAELERVVRLSAAAGFVPAACIWLIFSFAAAPLLELLYGPHYRAGAATLTLVSAGQVVNGLTGGSSVVLMMTGNQFSLMCISLCCGLILLVGSLALVHTHGMTGVAAATGFSVALHGVLSLLWAKHKTGIWTCFGGLGSIRGLALNFRS